MERRLVRKLVVNDPGTYNIINAHGVFVSSAAVAMEVKCFWKFGLRTDLVLDTMNQSAKQVKCEVMAVTKRFWLTVSSNQEVKKLQRIILLDFHGRRRAFHDSNLQFKVSSGAGKGQVVTKYKCDETSKYFEL